MSLIYEARWGFLEGALVTAQITLGAGIFALILAFLAGIGRLSRLWMIRTLALVYVETFRGVALLVQLFWLFFALPFFGIRLAPITAGIIGVGLCNGAYGAEIVRGAILAVPRGQRDAAIALNYSPFYRMWKVIVPQAIPTMLPPFGNLMIELLKGTSLVSLITVHDFSFEAFTLRETTTRTIGPYTVVFLGYFAMAMMITAGFRRLERRVNVGLDRGGIR